MITTLTAYGIFITNEFGNALRKTKDIVAMVKKHAVPDEDDEDELIFDDVPWLVTQASADNEQLLVGVHASMKEANTPHLHEKWLAVYQTVPEDIRQAIEAAGMGTPEMHVLSGKI